VAEPSTDTCASAAGAGIAVEPGAGGWSLVLEDVAATGGGGDSTLIGHVCAGRPALFVDHAGEAGHAGTVVARRTSLGAVSTLVRTSSSVNPAAAWFDAPLSRVTLDDTSVHGDVIAGSFPGAGVYADGALLHIGHSSLDGLIGLAVTRATVVVDHSTIGGTAYGVRATGGSGQATRTILVDSFVLARDTPVSSATAPAAA
jgi:hypothetical protein